MKKLISFVILSALCIIGSASVHAEENETEMTGGFVPVTLGGGGKTEYSDPVSPDTEQTQPGNTDTTPDTPESTPEPPPLVKPTVTPDTSKNTAPVKTEPAKTQPAKTTPARPQSSDTYTDNYREDDHPGYNSTHRSDKTGTPSASLTPGIRGTSGKTDLNITARIDANGNITLTWDKVKKADKYTIYLHNGTRYAKIGETAKTSYTYKGGKNGRTYKFVVRYTTGGETSSFSDSFKVTVTLKAAGKPVVTAVARGEDVMLSWNAIPNAKEYAVYRITGDKLDKILTTAKTTAEIHRLPTDKGYAVKAYVYGKWTSVSKDDIVTVK